MTEVVWRVPATELREGDWVMLPRFGDAVEIPVRLGGVVWVSSSEDGPVEQVTAALADGRELLWPAGERVRRVQSPPNSV